MPARLSPRRIDVARALLALVWAAAFVLAVGDRVPTTDADLPVVAALLLAAYPLIDLAASLAAARVRPDAAALRVNAAVSGVAAVAIGAAVLGSDAGSALLAFGAWATVSGGLQFALALRGRRQVPMLVSGGLSTLAGLSFLSAAGMDDAHLALLGGYMAAGAALYLVSAYLGRGRAIAAR
jgi:hypothetical protein